MNEETRLDMKQLIAGKPLIANFDASRLIIKNDGVIIAVTGIKNKQEDILIYNNVFEKGIKSIT